MKKYYFSNWKEFVTNFWARWFFVLFIALVLSVIFSKYELPEYLFSIPLSLLSVSVLVFFENLKLFNFLEKSMMGIITKNEYLKNLNREKIKEMLNSLNQLYYGLPDKLEDDSLYEFVDKNILEKHLGKAYICNSKVFVVIKKEKGKKYYKISIVSNYEIRTLSKKQIDGTKIVDLIVKKIDSFDEVTQIPLDEWYIKTKIGETGEEASINLPTKYLKLDKKDKVYKYSRDLDYSISKDKPLFVETTRVGYEKADESNMFFSFKLPIKGLFINFSVNGYNDTKFDTNFSGIPDKKLEKEKQIDDTTYIIEHNDWIIPGNSIRIDFKSPKRCD